MLTTALHGVTSARLQTLELVWTGPDGMKAVDYSRLSAVLIEALKELNRQVSDLESRLEVAGETQGL